MTLKKIKCPHCNYVNEENFDWLFHQMCQSHYHCNNCGCPFDENGDPTDDHIYVGEWEFDKSPAENIKKIEKIEKNGVKPKNNE